MILEKLDALAYGFYCLQIRPQGLLDNYAVDERIGSLQIHLKVLWWLHAAG